MLSRHNIRIKVLQTLYTHIQSPQTDAKTAEKNYFTAVNDGYKLYLYNLLCLLNVVDFNRKDFEIKTNKFVPTEADKKASLKLFDNPVAVSIRDNPMFKQRVKEDMLKHFLDEDLTRKLYQEFVQTDYYQEYLAMRKTPNREHQYCLVKLYKTMLENELFLEHMEDCFPIWDDDASLVFGAIKRTVRALPNNNSTFVQDFVPNREFVYDFGQELLYRAIHHDQELQDLIAGKLKNWQEDRVAIIDMSLLKLALCEFMYFPTIPTKVTINEYITIAKLYSTEKSKRFINGVLDRLMKELKRKGLILKTGRGLIGEGENQDE